MAEEKNNASGHLLDLSMIALKKKKGVTRNWSRRIRETASLCVEEDKDKADETAELTEVLYCALAKHAVFPFSLDWWHKLTSSSSAESDSEFIRSYYYHAFKWVKWI